MNDLLKATKALADPGRLTILKLLEQRELCVCELQAALGLAQPTVSKHLKLLEEAGLVGRRKEGLWVNFRLDPRTPEAEGLLGLVRGWLNDDPGVAALIARLPGIRREQICAASRGRMPESPGSGPQREGNNE
ncbi:MAG: metalloregulator ArsR/SmtB family transcription factor [Desulfobacteraceae bacterium]|nr:metalloregulator ArsR/SmtB family transcription factor [Desulfobacteraceae bacterium]